MPPQQDKRVLYVGGRGALLFARDVKVDPLACYCAHVSASVPDSARVIG